MSIGDKLCGNMASSADSHVIQQKREVSYFGPVYIAAYPTRHLTNHGSNGAEKAMASATTSEKGTSTEPFDISKYKISQGSDNKIRDKPESPKRSPKRFLKQMKLGIGGRLHRLHTNSETHRDAEVIANSKDNTDHNDHVDDYIKHEAEWTRHGQPGRNTNPNQHVLYQPRQESYSHTVDSAATTDNHDNYDTPGYQCGELVDETYEPILDNTFKISSTEDNYLKNKVLSNERSAQLSNTNDGDACINDTDKCIPNVEMGTARHTRPQDGNDTNNSIEEGDDNSKERVFKHREMIARLKRKFFESPPKRNNALQVKTNEVNKCEHLKKKVEQSNKDNIEERIKPDHCKASTEQIDTNNIEEKNRFDHSKPTTHELNNDNPIKSNKSECKDMKRKEKRHFATESRASRLRHSGKSTLGRQRRHSLDGKLSRPELVDDQDTDWVTQNTSRSAEYVAVVAIDFGTTQSGYAYSFLHDPGTIYTMRRHDGGDPGVYNQKVPTTILLTPDGAFHSFGHAAIDFYHDLDPKESSKWLFFDKFKMMLFHEKILEKTCMLRSVSGKEIPAMEIFARSLCYFKELVIEELSDQSDYRISCDVIRWVITVPAIWRASAKQFMREAAYDAGLVHASRPDQLLIALEPEAASIYCRKLRLLQVLESPARASQSDQSRASTLSLPELNYRESSHISNDLSVGTRYLVVDCGGGTVDITVHEILPYGRLKELHRASGGAHGSTGVDAEFERLLRGLFGDDIITNFKRKRPSGWVEVMAMFESRKRVAGPYRNSHISISLPFSFIDFYKKCRGHSVDSAVRKYGDHDVTWTGNGMLKLTPTAMRRLFLPTIDGMKQAIGSVMNSPNTRGLSYMFLVGGFAESSMVQHEIRKDFGELLKIIIPPGVGMTIVKGAVYFGLDPNVVSERRSCQTYGVGVLHRFDPILHPEEKRISKDGVDWCTDIFDVFVHVNQSVALGDRIIRRYTPVRRNQTTTTIHIYSVDTDNVLFISDDSVTRCGTLSLSLDDADDASYGSRREIRAEMTFGDTEIKVRATDVTSGRCVEAFIDFING